MDFKKAQRELFDFELREETPGPWNFAAFEWNLHSHFKPVISSFIWQTPGNVVTFNTAPSKMCACVTT